MLKNFFARMIPLLVCVTIAIASWTCVRNPAPIEPTPPPPPPEAGAVAPAPPRPAPVPELPPPPQPPLILGDEFASRTLEELNRVSPLEPVFFNYDSSDLVADALAVLKTNAEILDRYPTWIVTIEGHCDERGTAEYNLGLGERRALTAREYLTEMGVPVSQLRTVSYGKEFPFDPESNEVAWARNRRAHFVITAR